MFRLVVLAAVFINCATAANDPIREVTSQAMVVGEQVFPNFYKGYIYWAGENNPASVYETRRPTWSLHRDSKRSGREYRSRCGWHARNCMGL